MNLLSPVAFAFALLILPLPMARAQLPGAIAAPGETVVATIHAEGAQIYECKAGAEGHGLRATDHRLGWARSLLAPHARKAPATVRIEIIVQASLIAIVSAALSTARCTSCIFSGMTWIGKGRLGSPAKSKAAASP